MNHWNFSSSAVWLMSMSSVIGSSSPASVMALRF